MTVRSSRRMKCWMAGLLGMAPVLLVPSNACAIFPPIFHTATVTPTPIVVPTPVVVAGTPVTGTPVTIPVTVVGLPDPPPVVTVAVASTPEPATIVTGLMGLLCGGGYALRRKKK